MPVFKDVNKNFFKEWTDEMSYTLGFFAADGNMVKTKRETHFISFYSGDKYILQGIQKAMCSTHKLAKRVSKTGVVYRFQVGSKEMFLDLAELGFTERKSTRLLVPRIPKDQVANFVRGYFDGDGNVWVGMVNKNRRKPTRVLQVAFTSGSKLFIEGLLMLLRNCGIRGGSLYTSKRKNFTRLTLGTSDALKLSGIMYNGQPKLYLRRKKLRFEEFKVRHNCGGSSTG